MHVDAMAETLWLQGVGRIKQDVLIKQLLKLTTLEGKPDKIAVKHC